MKKKMYKIFSFILIVVLSTSIVSSHSYAISSINSNQILPSPSDDNSLPLKFESQVWTIVITSGEYRRDRHGITMLTNLLFDYGISEDNIFSLIEEDATKQNILTLPFSWLEEQNISDDDIVIFYFSLHGTQIDDLEPFDEPDSLDEVIVPYDYDFEQGIYIVDDELSDCFADKNLNNLVLLFETCFSGGMIDGNADLTNSGRVIITSADSDESSWPLYLPRTWCFPYYLFKGMSGQADLNTDGMLTAEETYAYAEPLTIFRSGILATLYSLIPFIPHEFVPQHPQLFDGWPTIEDNADDLILFSIN